MSEADERRTLSQSLTQLEAAVEDKLAKEEEQLNTDDQEGVQALKASDERSRLVSTAHFYHKPSSAELCGGRRMQEIQRMKSQLSDMEREKIAIERKFAALRDEVRGNHCTQVLPSSSQYATASTART